MDSMKFCLLWHSKPTLQIQSAFLILLLVTSLNIANASSTVLSRISKEFPVLSYFLPRFPLFLLPRRSSFHSLRSLTSFPLLKVHLQDPNYLQSLPKSLSWNSSLPPLWSHRIFLFSHFNTYHCLPYIARYDLVSLVWLWILFLSQLTHTTVPSV